MCQRSFMLSAVVRSVINVIKVINRIFHKHTKLAIMAILASQALLHENKKTSVTKCYPSEH